MNEAGYDVISHGIRTTIPECHARIGLCRAVTSALMLKQRKYR